MPSHAGDHVKALELAISAQTSRPDSLPGLVAVFAALPKLLSNSLATLSFAKAAVEISGVEIRRFADVCALTPGAIGAVVRAEKWNGHICFLADCAVTLSFVEALFGFDPELNLPCVRKPLAATERALVRLLFIKLARALGDGFSTYLDVAFDLAAIADDAAFAAVCAPIAPVIVARLKVDYGGSGGFVSVIIPQKLLDPVRKDLRAGPALQTKAVEQEIDPDWALQLSEQIARAFIGLKAVVDQRPATLQEVSGFKVGSTIELSPNSMARVRLELNERPLFWCQLGRLSGQLALKVETECDGDMEDRETI